MVSGGDFKHDSLKWCSKALSTVEKMDLNREIDPTNLETDTASHLVNGTQKKCPVACSRRSKGGTSTSVVALYAVDQHLSFSYNAPLRILDASCQVF